MEKPKMKVGSVVKDYNDCKYEVLKIAEFKNFYSNKLYEYDSTGGGQEMYDDYDDYGDEWWFVAVVSRGEEDYGTEYVFGVSPQSNRLGE
mgnify:CR=1|jgi:hypothetical protein